MNDKNQLTPEQVEETLQNAFANYEQNKPALKEQMFANRYKSLYTLPIFMAVMIGFLVLGYYLRHAIYFVFWYIWMGFASLLLLLSVYMFFSYLNLILKNKKAGGDAPASEKK